MANDFSSLERTMFFTDMRAMSQACFCRFFEMDKVNIINLSSLAGSVHTHHLIFNILVGVNVRLHLKLHYDIASMIKIIRSHNLELDFFDAKGKFADLMKEFATSFGAHLQHYFEQQGRLLTQGTPIRLHGFDEIEFGKSEEHWLNHWWKLEFQGGFLILSLHLKAETAEMAKEILGIKQLTF